MIRSERCPRCKKGDKLRFPHGGSSGIICDRCKYVFTKEEALTNV